MIVFIGFFIHLYIFIDFDSDGELIVSFVLIPTSSYIYLVHGVHRVIYDIFFHLSLMYKIYIIIETKRYLIFFLGLFHIKLLLFFLNVFKKSVNAWPEIVDIKNHYNVSNGDNLSKEGHTNVISKT